MTKNKRVCSGCDKTNTNDSMWAVYCSDCWDKQRTWVGLTDEDMKDPRTHNFDFIHGARWAEAKLKKKNT